MSPPALQRRRLLKSGRRVSRAVATAFPAAQVEVWATDEHRIGLQPLVRRVWTLPGARPLRPLRPLAPVEPRYQWRYLVAFVHPPSDQRVWQVATGVGAALFSAELAVFATAVGASPTKQIVLVLDGAGSHTSYDVVIPEHLHLFFLPSHSPELQPCEHLWPFSDAPLLNRYFASIEELEDVQLDRCAVLQQPHDLFGSATLLPWWPQRIRKRQGPGRSQYYTEITTLPRACPAPT